MGLDFLRRTAKSSIKAWNRGKASLSVPTLFGQQTECQSRAVVAEFDGDIPQVGEQITLHFQNGDIVIARENCRIGKVSSPPPDLVDALRNAGGCALGRLRQIHQLSGTADVEVE